MLTIHQYIDDHNNIRYKHVRVCAHLYIYIYIYIYVCVRKCKCINYLSTHACMYIYRERMREREGGDASRRLSQRVTGCKRDGPRLICPRLACGAAVSGCASVLPARLQRRLKSWHTGLRVHWCNVVVLFLRGRIHCCMDNLIKFETVMFGVHCAQFACVCVLIVICIIYVI